MLARCAIMLEVLLGEMYSQSSTILKHITKSPGSERGIVCFRIVFMGECALGPTLKQQQSSYLSSVT